MYLLCIFYMLYACCTYPRCAPFVLLLCCFVLAHPPRAVVFNLQPHGRLTANFWFCPARLTVLYRLYRPKTALIYSAKREAGR